MGEGKGLRLNVLMGDIMGGMFYDSQAKTVYARTQSDADIFNASGTKPIELQLIVKQ